LDGGYDFRARDIAPAVGNLNFEQPHYFSGGQVGVKLAGDSKKPLVDALAGPGRTGNQVLKEWRQFTP
jgi:hypothetical protein